MLSAATGAVMIGVLSMTLVGVLTTDRSSQPAVQAAAQAADQAVAQAAHASGDQAAAGPDQVARLGAELFTRHLVAVEVAGTLLFAALVGAVVVVAQGRAGRESSDRRTAVGRTGAEE
jgi:NADH:ubiquinone oxidoreductase subunit 6 (subunit J)